MPESFSVITCVTPPPQKKPRTFIQTLKIFKICQPVIVIHLCYICLRSIDNKLERLEVFITLQTNQDEQT